MTKSKDTYNYVFVGGFKPEIKVSKAEKFLKKKPTAILAAGKVRASSIKEAKAAAAVDIIINYRNK